MLEQGARLRGLREACARLARGSPHLFAIQERLDVKQFFV